MSGVGWYLAGVATTLGLMLMKIWADHYREAQSTPRTFGSEFYAAPVAGPIGRWLLRIF